MIKKICIQAKECHNEPSPHPVHFSATQHHDVLLWMRSKFIPRGQYRSLNKSLLNRSFRKKSSLLAKKSWRDCDIWAPKIPVIATNLVDKVQTKISFTPRSNIRVEVLVDLKQNPASQERTSKRQPNTRPYCVIVVKYFNVRFDHSQSNLCFWKHFYLHFIARQPYIYLQSCKKCHRPDWIFFLWRMCRSQHLWYHLRIKISN